MSISKMIYQKLPHILQAVAVSLVLRLPSTITIAIIVIILHLVIGQI